MAIVVYSVRHSDCHSAMFIQTGNCGAASAAFPFFETDFSSAAIFRAIDLSIIDNRFVHCASQISPP